jgi:hypothetical protein
MEDKLMVEDAQRISEERPQRAVALGGKGIAAKLALLRKSMGPVEKDGHDKHLGRRYITTDAMVSAVRDSANIIGLATTCRQRVLDWGTKDNGSYYNVVEVTIVFVDPDTGEYEQMVGIGMGEDKGARVMNIAVTYAMKNALKAGFLIGDEADTEGVESGNSRGQANGPGRPAARAASGLNDRQAQEIRGALAGVAGDQVRPFLAEFEAATPADIPAERFEEAKAKAARLPRPVSGRKAS